MQVINCELGRTEVAHYASQAAPAELSRLYSATGLQTIGGVLGTPCNLPVSFSIFKYSYVMSGPFLIHANSHLLSIITPHARYNDVTYEQYINKSFKTHNLVIV